MKALNASLLETAMRRSPAESSAQAAAPEAARNPAEDIRKYAAEQGIAEQEPVKQGREAKSKEFVEKGAEVYAKA